ncbi:MAG TPA: glycosyltransferase family 4 protein [Blastocatellia bacterium]
MAKEVIFVSGKYPGGVRGGHESFVRATARAACIAGFEPHIFCTAPAGGILQADYGYIHYVESPYRPFGSKKLPWQAPLLIASIERYLEGKPGPHLIHGFCVWGYVAVAVCRRLSRKGIEGVALINSYDIMSREAWAKFRSLERAHGWRNYYRYGRDYLWQRLFIRPYERYGYTRARVVAVNYDNMRMLVARAHGPSVRIRKLPYTSETAFLESARNEPADSEFPLAFTGLDNRDSPLIVTASRHSPRKGLSCFIHALARLRDAGFRFRACLVGGGELLAEHARMVEERGLAKIVAVTGLVPDSFAYISRADIFVLPSLEEGSGSVSLIEALQAGKAIVASSVDGIPEDITDGESALLVRPRSEAELAAAIGKLLSDSDLRRRLGRAARARFAERFSPAAFATGLGRLYAELGFTP